MAKSPIPPPIGPPGDTPPDFGNEDYPYDQWGEYFIENMDRAFDLTDGQRTYLQERIDNREIPLEDLKRGASADPARMDGWARDQSPRSYNGMNSFWYHPHHASV